MRTRSQRSRPSRGPNRSSSASSAASSGRAPRRTRRSARQAQAANAAVHPEPAATTPNPAASSASVLVAQPPQAPRTAFAFAQPPPMRLRAHNDDDDDEDEDAGNAGALPPLCLPTASQGYVHDCNFGLFGHMSSLNGRPNRAAQTTNAFCRLRERQGESMPPSNFLSRQGNLTPNMRAMLVDWLVEVGEEYALKSSTLFLCVSVIDRYLGKAKVDRDGLQLVGVAAMLIASKYEEMFPPQVDDFVYISGSVYSVPQVIKKEDDIMRTLEFKVTVPTVRSFLELFQQSQRVDDEVMQLSNFLGELALLDVEVMRFEPSLIACAAVSLALHTCNCPPWGADLERLTSYRVTELIECTTHLLRLFSDPEATTFQAIREKYSTPNPCLCVSNIPPPLELPRLSSGGGADADAGARAEGAGTRRGD